MSDAKAFDPYLDRTAAASDITDHYFPASPRGMREWTRVPTITIGGRACAKRSQWRAEAERRLREAQFDGREARQAKTERARQVLAAERGKAA